MNRRQAIQGSALLAGVALHPPLILTSTLGAEAPGPFTLPALGYPLDALEPHFDAQTMQIHHGKHHAAYVANLNQAVAAEPGLRGRSLEMMLSRLVDVPEAVRTAVRNHGGGHANHSMFWKFLKPNGGGRPPAGLAAALDKAFGGFSGFQEKFTTAALKHFGSGWAWLTMDAERALKVESTPNQDTPLSLGRTPLLALDLWEHAYYLRYQNRRADYVAAFFNLIDWDAVAERHQQALRA